MVEGSGSCGRGGYQVTVVVTLEMVMVMVLVELEMDTVVAVVELAVPERRCCC